MQLLINPKNQFLDNNGDPLAGGKLYFYEAGTTTPTDTYTDQAGGTSNTNPLILDSSGRGEAWLDPAVSYKVRLTDADDVQIWEVDNIEYLPDGFVTTAKLNDLAVTTAKLAASAVTTAKIKDLAVTTGKLADDAVTEAKLADDAVSTDKILDGAVTAAKLADRNIETPGSDSGSYSTSSPTESDITNLSDSITTSGRPVMIILQPNGDASNQSLIEVTGGGGVQGQIYLYRDSTKLTRIDFFIASGIQGGGMGQSVVYIDQPSAGTYTYKATAASATSDTINVFNYEIVLVEL